MKAISVLVLLFGVILMTVPSVVRAEEVAEVADVESESDDAVFAELEAADEAADEAEDAVEAEDEDESEAEEEDEEESEAEEEEESEEEDESEAEEEVDAAAFAEVQGADACLAGWNSAKATALGAAAASMQASWKAQGITYSQPHRSFGPKPSTKQSDCSGFVTSVLESVGADCLFAAGRYTAAMRPLMVARGGFHQVPKVGDIVMWGDHTGLITNKKCPKGKAELAAMGLHGCSISGCITVASMKAWGSGGWLGFWTPKAK